MEGMFINMLNRSHQTLSPIADQEELNYPQLRRSNGTRNLSDFMELCQLDSTSTMLCYSEVVNSGKNCRNGYFLLF